MKYIFLILASFSICFTSILSANESELNAAKCELVEVSTSDIRLICFFESATITTYFRKTLRKNFFFSIIPVRQDFFYHLTKQVFSSTKYESRLWNDGVAGYSFTYDNIEMSHDFQKFDHIYTTINDQYASIPFQGRYTLSGSGEELEIFDDEI